MNTQPPKPLLLRIAPAVLLVLAAYTAAFLALVLGTISGVTVGVAVGVAGPRGAAELDTSAMAVILMLQTFSYAAVAWGLWRRCSWSRPLLVLQGPALFLMLVVLARDSARLQLLTYVPQTTAIALVFYWYLYRKQNVREYWERTRRAAPRPEHA